MTGYLVSTLCQCLSSSNACHSLMNLCISAANVGLDSTASVHDLVDSTSMRCANKSEASRRTCERCAKSSICLTKSANVNRKLASGSRDSGAPALAASRAHAMASATFNLWCVSKALAFCAHSSASASWFFERRSSSIFSLTGLAAPLSRALNSLNTCCSNSRVGSLASQSRMRLRRSLEVAAVNAPSVRLSKADKSRELLLGVFTAVGGSVVPEWAKHSIVTGLRAKA